MKSVGVVFIVKEVIISVHLLLVCDSCLIFCTYLIVFIE